MSTPYMRSTRVNELTTGLKGFWHGAGEKLAPIYSQMFKLDTTKQKYEKFSEHYNIGLADVKLEGQATKMGGFAQGASPEYETVAYSLGITLTHESIVDNLYFKEGKDKVRALRKSFFTTKEIVHANVLNNAFNASKLMPSGDGQPLCSELHQNAVGVYTNKLPIPADLSEVSIEEALIYIKGMYDSSGVHKANLKAMKLWIPDQLMFTAERILKSMLQNNTANNAINALKSTGQLPGGYATNTYFTNQKAWFILTSAEKGLTSLQREPLIEYTDNDTKTRNLEFFAYERYSKGWTDPRHVFASEGL